MNYRFNIPVEPRTKKNHSQFVNAKGRMILIPSKQYSQFQKDCGKYLDPLELEYSYNLKCIFYMRTRRRVDLPNLLNAVCDVLTHYKVIADDNCRIISSFNGSEVRYDKEHPRMELELEYIKSKSERESDWD